MKMFVRLLLLCALVAVSLAAAAPPKSYKITSYKTPCPPGYLRVKNSTGRFCNLCPGGSFTNGLRYDKDNGKACSPCTPGLFASYGVINKGCAKCPAGSQVQADRSGCRDCPAGTFNPKAGASCQNCPAGQYSASPKSTKCTACPTGKTTAAAGANSADKCACPSYLQAGSGIDACACAAGFGYKKGSVCDACDIGTWNNGSYFQCQACPAGKITVGLKATSASGCICQAGLTSNPSGVDSCTCSSGNGYSAATATCQPCPAGQFNNGSYASCQDCPNGTTNLSPGSSSCGVCRAGTELDSTGVCVKCANGRVNDGKSKTCSPCPTSSTPNTNLTADPSATSCICNKGNLASSTSGGVTTYTCTCPLGTGWSDAAGSCQPCSGNTYNTGSSLTCQNCQTGLSANSKNTACNCPAGKGLSGTSCISCTSATGINDGTSGSCSTCASLYVQNGGTAPTPNNPRTACLCAAGTGYTSVTAGGVTTSGCTTCVSPNYNDGTFLNCTACPGDSLPVSGFSTCSCGAGKGLNAAGTGKCDTCPAGTFSTATDLTCRTCPAGTFCPAGTSVDPTVTTANQCPAAGSNKIKNPDGTDSADADVARSSPAGSASASDCFCKKDGTQLYDQDATAATCQYCPKGYFNIFTPTATITNPATYPQCQPCPANTYQDAVGKASCIACPTGKTTGGLTARISLNSCT